jgi:transposase-like protein
MSGKYVRYSVQFKRDALTRMETCRNVSALARELGVRRRFLYDWKRAFAKHGEAGLRSRPVPQPAEGRPEEKAAPPDPSRLELEQRVAELERQLGVKQLEVDFLRRTFEHVRGALDQSAAGGGRKSTTASEPGSRSKDRA